MPANPPAPVSRFVSAPDGLRLHLLDWDCGGRGMPVVCLPGLARTAEDFTALAERLAPARRVLALDYRGRGGSARDPDWKNYDIAVENADVLAQLTAVGIDSAFIVGTSRGGLHAMLLSATRPALLRAVVLNDIGPVIEVVGLLRISGYVGKLPQPASWPDAIDLMKRIMSSQFSGLDEAAWETFARLTFKETDGRLETRYDPALHRQLELLDLQAPVPQLWPQFDGLRHLPTLVLRGENSDLLSRDTLAQMRRRHEGLETHEVAGQGHAPLLLDVATLDVIADFIGRAERTGQPH